MQRYKLGYVVSFVSLAMLLNFQSAFAKTTDLLEMSEELDAMDLQDFQAAIDRASTCTKSRDFKCAESALSNASKSANSSNDKKVLLAGRDSLENEKQQLANEIKRAEEARLARIREQEERKAEEERQLRREQMAREAEERAAESEANTQGLLAVLGAAVIATATSGKNYTNEQRSALVESYARDRANAANGIKSDTFSETANQVSQKLAADKERAIAEAQRIAREKAAAQELPKYQPQVVTLPKADLKCQPGYTWYNEKGTGAPGGTCYKNSQAQTSAQVESNSRGDSSQQNSPTNKTSRQQTASVSGATTKQNTQVATTPVRQSPKTEWGPIQLEALAICNEKNGKWWCDGPLQNLLLRDYATLEEALSLVGCKTPIYSAGDSTNKGKQVDVYRCGYGLEKGDRDIAKIHGLITAQRSYMCPKYHGSACTDFYDGQDKR